MVMHGVNTIIEWRVRVPVNFDLPHPHLPRKFLKRRRESLAANGRVFIFVTVTKITLRLNVGAISRPCSAAGHVARLDHVVRITRKRETPQPDPQQLKPERFGHIPPWTFTPETFLITV